MRPIAPLIVINALDDSTRRAIHHQPHRTHLVGDNSIGNTTFNHVFRHIWATCINEAGNHVALTIEFRCRFQLILVQKALDEYALTFLPMRRLRPSIR